MATKFSICMIEYSENYYLRFYKSDELKYFEGFIRNNIDLQTKLLINYLNIFTVDDSKYILYNSKIYSAIKHFLFGIWNEMGNLIGVLALSNYNNEKQEILIGYIIDKDYRNRKIAFKFCNQLISFCYSELKIKTIFILLEKGNIASLNLAEKLGAKKEKFPTKFGFINKDYYLYSLTKK